MPFCHGPHLQQALAVLNSAFAAPGRHLSTACKLELGVQLFITGLSEALPADRGVLIRRLLERLATLGNLDTTGDAGSMESQVAVLQNSESSSLTH